MKKLRSKRLLSVSLFCLFLQSGCDTVSIGRDANEGAVVVKELAKASQSWDGAALPEYPKGQPQITILRIGIPAGTQLETHKHPVINAGVLISGQLKVVAKDGRTKNLKAGDSIVELVNSSHYGINEGNIPAEIIVFYAGSSGSPITVVDQNHD